jgi:hypothetical protein
MNTPKNGKHLILIALVLVDLAAMSLIWLRSTSVHAQSTASNRLRDTRAALEQAKSNEKVLRTKDASRTTDVALREYNAAVEARVAEIYTRLRDLNKLVGQETSSTVDVRGATSKPPVISDSPIARTESS